MIGLIIKILFVVGVYFLTGFSPFFGILVALLLTQAYAGIDYIYSFSSADIINTPFVISDIHHGRAGLGVFFRVIFTWQLIGLANNGKRVIAIQIFQFLFAGLGLLSGCIMAFIEIESILWFVLAAIGVMIGIYLIGMLLLLILNPIFSR